MSDELNHQDGESTHPTIAVSDLSLDEQKKLSDQAAFATLTSALKWTAIVAIVGALIIAIVTRWQNGAVFLVGGVISAASLWEWQRLMRIFTEALDQKKAPRGTGLVVLFFLVRLLFFAAAIYVSLKWLGGSPSALLGGLALAVLTLAWQALKLLRG